MRIHIVIPMIVTALLIVSPSLPAEGGEKKLVQIRFGSETNGVPWELRPEADRISVSFNFIQQRRNTTETTNPG